MGKLEPRPYIGGDSSLSEGERVIFCFKGERVLSFQDIIIRILETTPHTKGSYTTFDGGTENEWYIYHSLELKDCRVMLHPDATLPATFDDFQWGFNPHWDDEFNSFSEENEARLQKCYEFLQGLQTFEN